MQRFISAIQMVAVPMAVIVFVLLVSFYLFTQSLAYMGTHTAATVRDVTVATERALRENAEAHIAHIARSAARRLDIYLAAHPELTAQDLLTDAFIAHVGGQTIGETGYLSVNEAETTLAVMHPQKEVVGKIFSENTAFQTTQFESIRKLILAGMGHLDPVSGYYLWERADGYTVDKFLVNIATKNTTANGKLTYAQLQRLA